jgi:ABC-type molybdate transport system permease subunit
VIVQGLWELFAQFFLLLAGFFLDLIPAPPGWASSALSAAGEVLGYMAGFETWLPMQLAFTVAGAVIATYFVSLMIGATRWLLSYFFLGGGST